METKEWSGSELLKGIEVASSKGSSHDLLWSWSAVTK